MLLVSGISSISKFTLKNMYIFRDPAADRRVLMAPSPYPYASIFMQTPYLGPCFRDTLATQCCAT